jgi:hypothetical protein
MRRIHLVRERRIEKKRAIPQQRREMRVRRGTIGQGEEGRMDRMR